MSDGLKWAIFFSNIFLAVFLIKLDPGIALVNLACAVVIALSMTFTSKVEDEDKRD